MYRLKVLLQSKEEESLIFNPIFRQGLNQLILGGGADSAPLEFSPVGVRRAPKMISPKTLNVYVTNKKRIGSNTPKIGPVGPNCFFAKWLFSQKADFQENPGSHTKIAIAHSF